MRLFSLILLALTIAACDGAKTFDYTAVDEIQPGPGLLTGETGEYTIYKK